MNRIAQAAAIASLAAEAELLERVELTVKERTRVREALIADGWTVPPTEANFVWLRLGEHTLAFAEACSSEGIAVRPFADDGARVTIGDTDANDAFLAVAHAFPHRCLTGPSDLRPLSPTFDHVHRVRCCHILGPPGRKYLFVKITYTWLQ